MSNMINDIKASRSSLTIWQRHYQWQVTRIIFIMIFGYFLTPALLVFTSLSFPQFLIAGLVYITMVAVIELIFTNRTIKRDAKEKLNKF